MKHELLPVTVVIPAYRRPEMVERALRSVHAQCLRPAEVLVVDDCSGDDTGTRATNLGARLITHDRNLGRGASRNTGLQAATHDWVALLDSDDEWLPSHLETLWTARNGHALVGSAMLMNGNEQGLRVHGWTGRRPLVLRDPRAVASPENRLAPSAVLLRRRAALAVGGFRPDLPRAEDLDLWMRMLEDATAVALPRVTVLYHLHSGQVTADPKPMRDAKLAVIESHAGRSWCTSAFRQRHQGVLAWDAARAALAGGGPAVVTGRRLARQLSSPQKAIGVMQLLVDRFRRRRFAARLAPDGSPSVASLPGAGRELASRPGDMDLRHHSVAGALIYLARRPVSRARVSGRVQAGLVRLIGIEPIDSATR